MFRIPLGPLRRPIRFLQRQLPPLNFITLHYAYFIFTCLLFAVIFWGSSTPPRSISFTNSLFLAISAMTLAGLNTVNLSDLNTFQQILLFLLIMLGSAIFVSAFVVGVRKRAFEQKFVAVKEERDGRTRGRRMSRVMTWGKTTLKRRSAEDIRDAEAGEVRNKPHEENGDQGERTGQPASSSERDTTPPARRGGAEMNDISPQLTRDDPERKFSRAESEAAANTPSGHITFSEHTRFRHARTLQLSNGRSMTSHSIFSMQGVGARPGSSLYPTGSIDIPFSEETPAITSEESRRRSRRRHGDISHYFSSATGWISRNSQFHGLTQEERELLGGCEYRAVSFLGYLVPLYFVLWQLLGCLGCAAWVAYNQPSTARENGLNPWWVGAFNAVSAFNNSGMSLLDANMVAFQRSYYMLITMSLLILAGNTCYPIFLRLIIWTLYKLVFQVAQRRPGDEVWAERTRTLKFLLDHPRRCYTNLFPAQHTWWLAFSVFTLNSVDWAAFEILNIGNSDLDRGLPTRYRVIDGLFQAFAVRSGGFYVVSIPTLRISLQVLYVVMMYISVYPVVITMRNSNVYEERSLGIYADDPTETSSQEGDSSERGSNGQQGADVLESGTEKNSSAQNGRLPQQQQLGRQFSSQQRQDPEGPLLRHARTIGQHFLGGGGGTGPNRESNSQFIQHQLRAQLAHDAWWIVLALFLIMISEAHAFHEEPVVYSVFNFLFEIVSAYGCVGISVGVPWNSYSFCGAWTTLSRLILCAVMLRGRHRGLPVAIDKAVLLPGELQERAEEEDGRIREVRARTMSRARSEV